MNPMINKRWKGIWDETFIMAKTLLIIFCVMSRLKLCYCFTMMKNLIHSRHYFKVTNYAILLLC